MSIDSLRAAFPVLEHTAYLNAGTDGPVPRVAVEAAGEQLRQEAERGRSGAEHFERMKAGAQALRERLASLIGAQADEVALTHCTTDGITTVLSALPLGPGDEVLTSDEEHPGLLAPLAMTQRRKGFEIREVAFDELAASVGPRTKLVACSHVSWVSGRVVDAAGISAAGIQLLLDGAQGIGAVPVDVAELRCDFYAASGQKWLCGPDGSGCLYVRAERVGELDPPWPNYGSLEDAQNPLDLVVHPGARRFDLGISPGPSTAWATAAFDLLAGAGWPALFERAADGADRLAGMLGERGVEVARRGRSTLVSWASADPEGDVERLAAAGVVVRHLPGLGLVRASVGAWSSDDDLERLVAGVTA